MAKPTLATTLLDFLRANAASPPHERCETTVATRLSSDYRGFRRVMKVVNDLTYKGTIKREHVDNWACVLSLANVVVPESELYAQRQDAETERLGETAERS